MKGIIVWKKLIEFIFGRPEQGSIFIEQENRKAGYNRMPEGGWPSEWYKS